MKSFIFFIVLLSILFFCSAKAVPAPLSENERIIDNAKKSANEILNTVLDHQEKLKKEIATQKAAIQDVMSQLEIAKIKLEELIVRENQEMNTFDSMVKNILSISESISQLEKKKQN